MTSPVPEQIGRYRILSELGKGSMARVYVAEDPNIGRRVALKVLDPSFDVGPETERQVRQRFVLEARAAGRLNHPGIVTIFDAGTDEALSGLSYIAMEWVEGTPLDRLVEARGPLSAERAAALVARVARALDYAHRAGVVHRDIKPANILVRDSGEVKVLDFGIAKVPTESHTLAGQILGSPAFMSPEQVRGDDIDGRSDLFSLGAVLYFCLTGRSPFHGESLGSITYCIVHGEPHPFEDADPPVPETVGEVLRRALAKEPEERFQTGLELAQALEAWGPARDAATEAEGTLPREPSEATGPAVAPGLPDSTVVSTGTAWQERRELPPPPARSPRRWWIGAAALVLVAGIWGLLALPGSPPREPAMDEEPRGPAGPVEPAPRGTSPPGEPGVAAVEGVDGEAEAEETPAVAPVRPVPTSTVTLVFQNRLAEARLSLRVDGRRVWSRQVSAPKNVFKRVAGQKVEARIPVAPGDHSFEVRIHRGSDKDPLSSRLQAALAPGETRQLVVGLNPISKKLKLRWD